MPTVTFDPPPFMARRQPWYSWRGDEDRGTVIVVTASEMTSNNKGYWTSEDFAIRGCARLLTASRRQMPLSWLDAPILGVVLFNYVVFRDTAEETTIRQVGLRLDPTCDIEHWEAMLPPMFRISCVDLDCGAVALVVHYDLEALYAELFLDLSVELSLPRGSFDGYTRDRSGDPRDHEHRNGAFPIFTADYITQLRRAILSEMQDLKGQWLAFKVRVERNETNFEIESEAVHNWSDWQINQNRPYAGKTITIYDRARRRVHPRKLTKDNLPFAQGNTIDDVLASYDAQSQRAQTDHSLSVGKFPGQAPNSRKAAFDKMRAVMGTDACGSSKQNEVSLSGARIVAAPDKKGKRARRALRFDTLPGRFPAATRCKVNQTESYTRFNSQYLHATEDDDLDVLAFRIDRHKPDTVWLPTEDFGWNVPKADRSPVVPDHLIVYRNNDKKCWSFVYNLSFAVEQMVGFVFHPLIMVPYMVSFSDCSEDFTLDEQAVPHEGLRDAINAVPGMASAIQHALYRFQFMMGKLTYLFEVSPLRGFDPFVRGIPLLVRSAPHGPRIYEDSERQRDNAYQDGFTRELQSGRYCGALRVLFEGAGPMRGIEFDTIDVADQASTSASRKARALRLAE